MKFKDQQLHTVFDRWTASSIISVCCHDAGLTIICSVSSKLVCLLPSLSQCLDTVVRTLLSNVAMGLYKMSTFQADKNEGKKPKQTSKIVQSK